MRETEGYFSCVQFCLWVSICVDDIRDDALGEQMRNRIYFKSLAGLNLVKVAFCPVPERFAEYCFSRLW